MTKPPKTKTPKTPQKKSKPAEKRGSPPTKIGARFLFAVDDYLRKRQRGRGDMSNLIAEAIQSVDLASVELTRFRGKKQPTTARATQLVMPLDMRQELERWAERRLCTMNELLNSAVVATMPRGTAGGWAHSSAGSFDKLPPQEQEGFFADLVSQTGMEPGPDSRAHDGGYYDYDPKLREAVEVTKNGRRFVVEAIEGGELVRVREAGQAPFLEKQH